MDSLPSHRFLAGIGCASSTCRPPRASQQVSQSSSQPVGQSASQPVSRSASRLTSQTVNCSLRLLILLLPFPGPPVSITTRDLLSTPRKPFLCQDSSSTIHLADAELAKDVPAPGEDLPAGGEDHAVPL
eukprot:5767514-Pyramimonas_sp.AAC.1